MSLSMTARSPWKTTTNNREKTKFYNMNTVVGEVHGGFKCGVNARACPELKYCMEIPSLTSFYADAEVC